MSAIAGLIRFRAAPADEARIQHMLPPMEAYASDGQTIWEQEGNALAYLRNISTPEDRFEQQPLEHTDAGLVLVATSRLDNREELFQSLSIPARERATTADSVLILKAYQRWGEQCPAKLLGDFSFALWDRRKQKLFLATDYLGNYSLCYHHRNQRLAFATRPKGLLALPDVSRKLNEKALATFLLPPSLPGPPPNTYFEDIQQLPGGHSLSVDENGVRLSRYWRPEMAPSLHFHSDQEWREAFRERFFDAVRARLRHVEPTAVMLSGGLDSAAVASVTARILRDRGETLKAYSYRPAGPCPASANHGRISDETAYAQAVADHQENIELEILEPRERHHLSQLEPITRAIECPMGCNSDWFSLMMERTRADGQGNLLTGAWGNLCLSHIGIKETVPAWVRTMAALRHSWRDRALPPWPLIRREMIGSWLPSGVRQALRTIKPSRSTAQYQWLTPDIQQRYLLQQLKTDPGLLDQTHSDQCRENIANSYGEKQFKVRKRVWMPLGRHYGLSINDPTQDRRLAEFCFQAPNSVFRKDGRPRLLVVDGMKDLLPERVLGRTRRGLQFCDGEDQIRRAGKDLKQCLTQWSTNPNITEVINMDHLLEMHEYLLRHSSPPPGNDRIVWALGFWNASSLAMFIHTQGS